jgi:tRNA pseudouridine55 synthase
MDGLDCTRFDSPDAELHIRCSSGTYVRSLVRDLGDELGCGAVMTSLVRTAIGPFRLTDACNVEDVDPQILRDRLLPPRAAVQELAEITVPTEHLTDVAHGRAFAAALPGDVFSPGQEVALLNPAGELLAVAELDTSGRRLCPRVVLIDPPK